jgi:Ribbon-helix-helix protein, copG family
LSSSTIRVPKRDKERLERLAKKTGSKKLSEAFRFALSAAERETDRFHGNIEALIIARKSARAIDGRVSENVDEILAEGLYDERSNRD